VTLAKLYTDAEMIKNPSNREDETMHDPIRHPHEHNFLVAQKVNGQFEFSGGLIAELHRRWTVHFRQVREAKLQARPGNRFRPDIC
jgi:hypothetical protein